MLPTPMVMTRGENVSLGVVTVALPALTAMTVTVAVPVLVAPPDTIEAVIVAEPAVTPVTTPLPLTVATPVLPEAHVAAGNPVIAVPLWSSAEAVSCTVAPTLTLGVAGVTATEVNTGVFVPCTITVPTMPEWRVHSYGYVPAVGNVLVKLFPVVVLGASPPVGLFVPNVTLWVWTAICHVTLAPCGIVIVTGLKLVPVVVTTLDAGGKGGGGESGGAPGPVMSPSRPPPPPHPSAPIASAKAAVMRRRRRPEESVKIISIRWPD